MKRFLAFFCVFAILFCGIFVYAEPQNEITVSAQIIRYGSGEQTADTSSYDRSFGGLNHTQINTLRDSLFHCLNNMDESIDVSEYGFESFETSRFISKNDFLAYVGMRNGTCLPPFRDDIEKNQQYKEFKDKYNICLNKQQERALLAVEGANLLLAVPGSGKTTVLVSRMGHMVINKNIPPESILAITFAKVRFKKLILFAAQSKRKV